jgi:hypothetical protein
MGGFVIDIFVAFVGRVTINLWRVFKARKWPVVKGRVIRRSLEEPGYGCEFVELKYNYKWEGERNEGVFREPFLFRHSKAFDQATADSEISVRVNPEDPEKSIPANA